MRFDDRLKTVMMQPVEDNHDRTVRWRQLVDLLSRPAADSDEAMIEAALALVRKERRLIPEAARAATARMVAGRSLDPRLVAIFVRDKVAIAAPLLVSATFDQAGWEAIERDATPEVAAFLASVSKNQKPSDDPVPYRAPPIEDAEITDIEDRASDEMVEPPVALDDDAPSIGEMVARIEKLRSLRPAESERPNDRANEPGADAPGQDGRHLHNEAEERGSDERDDDVPEPVPAAASGEVALFRWECDPVGQIGWVEGAPRGVLIGRNLAEDEDIARDRELVRALADRAPFNGAVMKLVAPAVEGEWHLSGIPAFSPHDGRFLGYRGVARRMEAEPPRRANPEGRKRPTGSKSNDALRETIHEIKTPLNAIIGFAEIIDGQYLGPAHRNYRLRAAEIVGQARTLMGAIEDLDLAARLQAEIDEGRHVAALENVMAKVGRDLEQRAASVGIELRFDVAPGLRLGMSQDMAERLIRRFLTAAVATAERDEKLLVGATAAPRNMVQISVSRPMSTVGLSEDMLVDPSFVAAEGESGSILGLGFALRMVRGLARMAGGGVSVEPAFITVRLPQAKS